MTPYYAVIFRSERWAENEEYNELATLLEELAKKQPGYLDFVSGSGLQNISISYWENLEAVNRWKNNATHQLAMKKGKDEWYKFYAVEIAKIERAYSWHKE